MDIFLARQPIFDCCKNIYAYELLFRAGMSNIYPDVDGETATSRLLSSFLTVGIDQVSAGKKVFVNFTEELLRKGTAEMFPSEKVVVEVLEDVPATTEIVEACERLVEKGYSLALDDFVYDKGLKPLIQLADFIKIDFRQTPQDKIRHILADIDDCKCKLLAEKVETHEEFRQAEAQGFSYFQGYFFARPEVVKNKELSSSQMTLMNLIAKINLGDFDLDSLERMINQDVSLSYKLLNYINTEFIRSEGELSSVRQALDLLGERGIRIFVSLIAASSLAEQKPHELMKASILRARFLEQIGTALSRNSSEFFMMGLFSLIDAMLDNSMENLLEKLPLSQDVSSALIDHAGRLYPYLRLVEKYESCEWTCVDSQLDGVGISGERILGFYLDALKMADEY